jgi:hypothetical protein
MESVTSSEDVTPPPGWLVADAAMDPAADEPLPATNGLATAALVLGVLALSLALNPLLFLLAAPAGLTAVVLGWLGTQRARESGLGRGQAIGGLVTGLLAVLLAALAIAGALTVISAFRGTVASAGTEGGAACAAAEDVRIVGGERRAGDYVLSDIQVCSDAFDDFAFSASVHNDGVVRGLAMLELEVVDGTGVPLGTGSGSVLVEPGETARADFLSADAYRADWSDVTVRVSGGGA